MINNERIDFVLDQINDLHALVEGLKECDHPVPSFLIKLCDNKLEKVRKNLHSLRDNIAEIHPNGLSLTSLIEEIPLIDEKAEDSHNRIDNLDLGKLISKPFQSDVEFVEGCTTKKEDDFDRFVSNLVQPNLDQETVRQKTTNTDCILGEKFESQILHEKISSTSNEQRVVEQVIGSWLKVDLNKAISLNDKFRFQRELFQGNGAKMAEVFNKLSQCLTHDECVKYIQKNFSWEESNDTVKYFYSIIEKRF